MGRQGRKVKGCEGGRKEGGERGGKGGEGRRKEGGGGGGMGGKEWRDGRMGTKIR
jgi:hypothetical protein